MSYILPAGVDLGPAYAGQVIGYRLVNLDESEAEGFSTTNVTEIGATGIYKVMGGIAVPANFAGRIEWKTADGPVLAASWFGPGDFEYIDAKVSDAVASVPSGSGNRVISGVIDDGTDPLEGVIVVAKLNGIEKGRDTSDADGAYELDLNDATYKFVFTEATHTLAPQTVVVTADSTDQDFTMSAVVVSSPTSPGGSVGLLTTLNEHAVPSGGVTVTFQIMSGDGTDGLSYTRKTFTVESGSDGVLEVELPKGSRCRGRRGVTDIAGGWTEFDVPDDADSFNLPEVLGVMGAED